jgi:hypothetical protein
MKINKMEGEYKKHLTRLIRQAKYEGGDLREDCDEKMSILLPESNIGSQSWATGRGRTVQLKIHGRGT